MRASTHLLDVARALALVALAGLAITACAKSASDCAQLGLPDGCSTTTTTTTTGTGGTTTTSTTTTSSTTTNTGGTGGGTGGSTGGTGGVAPVNEFLPVCVRKFWGDAENQAVRALVADPLGAAIAGDFQGKIDVGTGPLTAAAGGSMFVARLATTLAPTWSKSFDATLLALTSDTLGNVFIAGRMTSPLDFGGPCTPLDPLQGGFFLVELDVAGKCVYARNYDANVTRASLAVDAVGNVVLAGGITGTGGFGSPIVANGGEDIVLASFDSLGAATKTRTFGSAGDEHAVGVARDANGNVTLTGAFAGTVDFASGDGVFNAAGQVGVFAAGFNATLGSVWSKHLKSATDADAVGVVALPSGVAIGGTFVGAIDLGDTAPLMSAGGGFFLARYGTDGAFVAQSLVDGIQPGAVSAMAAGSAGDVAFAGSGLTGLLLGRVNADGMIKFAGTATGTGTHHRATAAAFADVDQILLGGFFDGSLNEKSPAVMTSAGGDDALVLKVCLTP